MRKSGSYLSWYKGPYPYLTYIITTDSQTADDNNIMRYYVIVFIIVIIIIIFITIIDDIDDIVILYQWFNNRWIISYTHDTYYLYRYNIW